jgi:mRNA interferase MazF
VAPRYGEVWLCELDPVRGHEQAGRRPALVVSPDRFNQGPAGLVIVVPLTTRDRRVPLHVAIDPPEGGLRGRSFALCEMVRSIAIERLVQATRGARSAAPPWRRSRIACECSFRRHCNDRAGLSRCPGSPSWERPRAVACRA